jgi:hypothetical protein
LGATPPTFLDALEFLVQRLRFLGPGTRRQRSQRGVEIALQLGRRAVMLRMKGDQLGEDHLPVRQPRMVKDLAARDQLEGDAAEAQAELDAGVPRVLALRGPLAGQRLEVAVAADEPVVLP